MTVQSWQPVGVTRTWARGVYKSVLPKASIANILEKIVYRRQSACMLAADPRVLVWLPVQSTDCCCPHIYSCLLLVRKTEKKLRIGVFIWATSAPNHATVVHHRTGNCMKTPWNGQDRCEEHTTVVLVRTFFLPGGVSLVTSASYKLLIIHVLGTNSLSHHSRESVWCTCKNEDI